MKPRFIFKQRLICRAGGKVILAGLLLLFAAPAVEPKSPSAQCNDRCQVNYKACLKRTTTSKGRDECAAQRKVCHKTCPK